MDKEEYKINRKMRFKWTINTYLSVISLNVNGLNAPIKRHRVADWIEKQEPIICCPRETHIMEKDTHRLKRKGWKKIIPKYAEDKKVRVVIFTSDKTDFKQRP